MDLKSYKVDLGAEKEGVWVKIGEDAELLIARWLNPACREAMAKYAKEFVTVNADAGVAVQEMEKRLDDGSSAKMLAHVIADSVLLGWRGNLRMNGELLEYSRERALELMGDPQLHDLREFVMEQSMSRANFLAKHEQELVGN